MSDFEAFNKQEGVTASERILNKLCEKSFLSLWSYPCVYRDQGESNKNHTLGKEVCDLIVVCGNNVIIFSDKYCQFQAADDLELSWNRWFKKAILNSAKQIWGAERWIKSFPERLYLDKYVKKKFPLRVPELNKICFHRILVANGAKDACQKYYSGSGSFLINNAVKGNDHCKTDFIPFCIGDLDPDKGFVHVFDEVAIGIIFGAINTITDFIGYITKREKLIRDKRMIVAAGEEELLAIYLRSLNQNNEHDFIFPSDYTAIIIPEGEWIQFSKSDQRRRQAEEDEISFAWDDLIDKFSHHILNQTSLSSDTYSISQQEEAVRFMALEPRLIRRTLAYSLLEFLDKSASSVALRNARIIPPMRESDPYYIFLALAYKKEIHQNEYRKIRIKMLEDYCVAVKHKFSTALDIVGIATEPGLNDDKTEDIVYLNARNWNKEQERYAKSICDEGKLLKSLGKTIKKTVYEYPV